MRSCGAMQERSMTNDDSYHVQAWLIPPAHPGAGKHPLVVQVHGGPSSAVRRAGLTGGRAAGGPVVITCCLPNPRGSYGQGELFTQANVKDFGYGDLRDILAAVDTAGAKYPVDPQRLGFTGWSYGGYMTMFAVTQTKRFKAAVAGAGIANWTSYYGENLIDRWMIPFFGASVYDVRPVYAKVRRSTLSSTYRRRRWCWWVNRTPNVPRRNRSNSGTRSRRWAFHGVGRVSGRGPHVRSAGT